MNDVKADAKAIFLEALDCKGSDELMRFLQQACGADAALRTRVDELLRAHRDAGAFLGGAEMQGATCDQPRAERPGTVIGPYKLLQQIGEGGMGTVFMAEQTHPVKRKVALKVIKPGMDSCQVIARFEAERQALAMMDHVNIARVFDGGTTASGRPYFVMELVHGVPITKYCDDNQLTPRERLELFVPVCQAIQHAHQKGIIHRDIKPSNVMITLYDGKPVPKVIDFGVAKATEQKLTERTLFTQYGTMIGTLEYMSPEQAEMSALGADTRSDIYSLGVLLYELLTGSTPLSHKRVKEAAFAEILRMIKEEEPPRPSTRLSDSGEALASISAQRHMEPAKLTKLVKGELDWIVLKALEKDRTRRYETASGFSADVQRYLNDEAVLACPPSAWYRFRKFGRRHKRALATITLLGVMLLVAVGAVAGSLGWMSRDRAARRLVVEQAVGRALEEGDELQKQGKWKEALGAVERAGAALASGDVGAEVQQQVRDQLADLHLILRLDAIRAGWGERFDHQSQDRGFSRLFADLGIDVESLSPADLAARIRRRPSTAIQVAAGLDEWARVLRDWEVVFPDLKRDPATWKRLLEAARLADPDPWRSQLRQSMGQEDLNALRKLADSSDMAALPVQSLQLMSCALIFGGDGPACVAWLRKAHRRHPGDTLISFDLSFHLSNLPSADWVEVLRFAQAALASRPQSPGLSHWVGICLHRLGRFDEAAAEYTRAIELKPDGWQAWSGRAFVYFSREQWDKAIRDFSKAIDLAPQVHTNWWHRGHAYLRLAQWDKAAADFGQVVEQWPDQAEGWYLRAGAFAQLNQPDKALADLRQAIAKGFTNVEQMKNDPMLVPLRAGEHFGKLLAAANQQRPEAEEVYREAIAANTKLVAESNGERGRWGLGYGHEKLGLLRKRAGKLDEAAEHLRAALVVWDSPAAEFNKADYRRHWSETHRALAEVLFDRAREVEKDTKLSPAERQAAALAYRGKAREVVRDGITNKGLLVSWFNLADYPEAEPLLMEVLARLLKKRAADHLEISLDLSLWMHKFGLHYLRGGQYDKAEQMFRACLPVREKKQPNAWQTFNTRTRLGAALLGQQKYAEAEPFLLKGYEGLKQREAQMSPGEKTSLTEALNWLIELYDAWGQKDKADQWRHLKPGNLFENRAWDEAVAAYQEALRVQPNLEEARDNLVIAFAMLGQWEKAAAIKPAIERQRPDSHGFQLACARLLVGDNEGYKELRRHFIDRAGQTKDPNAAFFLCRTCLLSPQGLAEPAHLVSWSKQAVASRPKCGWFLHALGAAHYRAGQFDQAIRRCRESMEADPRWAGHMQNWLVLAMAHQRLGQTQEARQWLEKAFQWWEKIAQGRPKTALPAPIDVDPSDWLEFLVLYPEAQALVQRPAQK